MSRYLFILMMGMVSCLRANTISLNTGTGGAPWTVQSAYGNVLMVIGSPNAAWATATAALAPAQWVGVNSAGAGGPGTYTYQLSLGSLFGGSGNFSLRYSADNAVGWSITNGTLSGTTQCQPGNADGNCFTGVHAMSGTFAATSVLTATVTNGLDPTGLIVQGTATVPEPSAAALLLVGGAWLGIMRLRGAGRWAGR